MSILSAETRQGDEDRTQTGLGLGLTTDLNFFEDPDEVLKPEEENKYIVKKVVRKGTKHQTPPMAKNPWDDPYLS